MDIYIYKVNKPDGAKYISRSVWRGRERQRAENKYPQTDRGCPHIRVVGGVAARYMTGQDKTCHVTMLNMDWESRRRVTSLLTRLVPLHTFQASRMPMCLYRHSVIRDRDSEGDRGSQESDNTTEGCVAYSV